MHHLCTAQRHGKSSPPAASAGESAGWLSRLSGRRAEVRLRLSGGIAAKMASGCSGAFAGESCMPQSHKTMQSHVELRREPNSTSSSHSGPNRCLKITGKAD